MIDFQEFSAIYDVRQVEINNVVACDDIRVYFLDKIAPFGKE